MLAFPRVLSLVTTRRCTAACDHCCVGASPRATDAIPVERLHRLIDEATRVPSFERIVFTGGECFLLGHELDVLIAHAKAARFQTRAITNGYWAVNVRSAAARALALRAAGLDEIMFSTGTFHQRFVRVDRLLYAARATASAGIATRISVESCDQSRFDRSVLDDDLADLVAAGMVRIVSDPWIPDAGGRGGARLSHDAFLAENGAGGGRCAQIFTIVSVTPRQMLTACCGFPHEELPALQLGSVAERALDAVIAEAPNALLRMWLHVAGPAGVAEFVARYRPGYRLPAFASVCEGCVALQRDPEAMRIVAEHAGEAVGAVATEFVRLQPPGHAALRAAP